MAGIASPKRSEGGCRITVIISPFQGDDGGSIPLTRSKISLITKNPPYGDFCVKKDPVLSAGTGLRLQEDSNL
jgi:hypothetical protein